ncbi:hypothetical protein E8E14_000836 [Neopestalotiopsis sp. 37M]|nr:hypothetical protein E8E14_000836 [Neopestalotiopsis sp. 37M]
MRFASFFIAVSLAQSALGAVLPIGEDKRALAFGNANGPVELEANDAKIEQVYKGIDYLVKVFEDKSIDYGLMGGIAMQLFGMKGRETHDGDMAISVNSAELLDAVQDDPNIRRPGRLMAASGTARLFVKIDEQQVGIDVFVSGGDQTPSLDTDTIDNYKVVKVGEIAKSKFKRLEDKDIEDIMWLIDNKPDDIKAIADDVDEDQRLEFAEHFEDADDDRKERIAETLKIDEDEIDD